MKRKDVILFLGVLLLAGGMALLMRSGQEKAGESIRIMVNGREYGNYPLMQENVIEVENEHGYNRLVVKDGVASMEAADCPDQYCVEHKPVSKTHETIVCLPHKLVVEVLSADGSDIDSIAQ